MECTDILNIIEVVALILTLIFVAIQTRISNKNVNEIKKTMLQNSINSDNDSTNSIYKTFVDNPDIAREYGYEKIDAFNLMIIEHFETRYLLRSHKLIKDDEWKSDLFQIKRTMNRDKVKMIWERDKREFDEKFATFIDNEIIELEKKADNIVYK